MKDRRKTDSRGAEVRDRGSVSVALEGNEKRRLTGEPVRTDQQPTSGSSSGTNRAFHIKQEKGQKDSWMEPHGYSCGPAPH